MSQATWSAVSALFTGTSGAVTATIPAHSIGQCAILVAEGVNTTWGSDPAGWTPIVDETFTTISKLKAWMRILTSTTENVDHPTTITPTGTVDHTIAYVMLADNVHATKPIQALSVTQLAASTGPRFPSFKTYADLALAVQFGAYSLSSAGPICSAQANGGYAPVERLNAGAVVGNGGGHVLYTGPIAAAAQIPCTTFTCTSTGWILVSLVLNPIADKTIAATWAINGSPAANGGNVRALDITQPVASGLAAATVIAGGAGGYTIKAPYTTHTYQAVADNGASYGASPPSSPV